MLISSRLRTSRRMLSTSVRSTRSCAARLRRVVLSSSRVQRSSQRCRVALRAAAREVQVARGAACEPVLDRARAAASQRMREVGQECLLRQLHGRPGRARGADRLVQQTLQAGAWNAASSRSCHQPAHQLTPHGPMMKWRSSCFNDFLMDCPDANLIAAFLDGTLEAAHAEELVGGRRRGRGALAARLDVRAPWVRARSRPVR